MPQDYPDYYRGTLDIGFTLLRMGEISFDVTVPAGLISSRILFTLSSGEFAELLALVASADQVPASPPSMKLINWISGAWRIGVSYPLTIGESLGFYELDIFTRRFRAFTTPNLTQYAYMSMPANAASDTLYKVRGVYTVYRMIF